MSAARADCAAVFAGGRVVVFGGLEDGSPLNTTLLLDTHTMAFTAGPSLLAGRRGCAAIQIDAGRVLVVGGYSGTPLNTTEIFHLSTLTVTPGPNMLSERLGCAAVALDARRILVVGGYDGRSRLSTTEIFSLDTMAFAPGPTMATRRNSCAAVALDEHRIMVTGGKSSRGQFLNTTEVLDVRTMAFAPGPSMGSAHCYCTAVQVDDRHVLVIGGQDWQDSAKTSLATTELLDVATMEFSPGPTMTSARSGIAAVRLGAAEEAPRILLLEDGSSTTEVLAVDAPRGRERHAPGDSSFYLPRAARRISSARDEAAARRDAANYDAAADVSTTLLAGMAEYRRGAITRRCPPSYSLTVAASPWHRS
jgi:hypothetical protein